MNTFWATSIRCKYLFIMFKALAWIHLLQLLTGTLSQENKVTSIEPYEGVQIYFTIDDSRTRVPLDLLIDGLQKYLVKICDTVSRDPRLAGYDGDDGNAGFSPPRSAWIHCAFIRVTK